MKGSKTVRVIMRSINGSINTITELNRDPPILDIANLARSGEYTSNELEMIIKESLKLASSLNEYKREYWKLELLIKQDLMDRMKRSGYMPGRSIELESLRNALPESIIKGDERIWIYSYDHYIERISEQVGRRSSDAPRSEKLWKDIERNFVKRISSILKKVNDILPELYHFRSKLKYYLKEPSIDFNDIKIKKVKVSKVQRPIRKIIVIKKPIPLPKKVKSPRKRILKKGDVRIIGPEVKK
jgi:hypothetical protein